MKRFSTLCLLAILASASWSVVSAQDVVVSEYYNDVAQDREWSEFLVVKDNVNLVGYVFTDNRGTQDQRQSGPLFLDIPLWRNVRAGTIIVLHHDAIPPTGRLDTNARDGYLEFSQFDTRFFRIVNVDGAGTSFGMNINVDRDFVQVLARDTTHVHGLGHGRPVGSSYTSAPEPKVNHDTSNMGTSRSVCITGSTIAAYNSGVGKDSTSSGLNTSRGFPNLVDNTKALAGVKNTNQLFWRATREPKFIGTPTVTVIAQTASKHTIQWSPVVDTYSADSTTGYLILRDTENFSGFQNSLVVDGKIISAGSQLGTALVLAVQPTIMGNVFTDSLDLKCGTKYAYRVYSYRYSADDIIPVAQTADTMARGRQYNEVQYGQSPEVLKPNPTKPQIFAGRTEICPGDTLSIFTTTTGATRYEWTVNGLSVPVGGTTSIVVRTPGTYRLLIYADGGCFSESDPLVISPLPGPTVSISPSGTQTICSGDTVLVTCTTNGSAYQWLFNGNVVTGATQTTFRATQEGIYQVLMSTAFGCPGLSPIVRIRFPDVKYRFQPVALDLGELGQCQNSTSLTTELVNTGTEPLTITRVIAPVGFTISSPALGFVVPAGQRQIVRILFAPPTTGSFTGRIDFVASPCGIVASVAVTGSRSLASATLDKAAINFGVYTACPSTDIRPDSAIRVTNTGSGTITISAPLVTPPFYLLTQFISEQLPPGQSKVIRIQYRPFGPDLDKGVIQEIKFPFVATECNDTLRATLEGASFKPAISYDSSALDLGLVLSCNPLIDTVVEIFNTGFIPVTVTGTALGLSGGGIDVVDGVVGIEPGTSKTIRIRTQVTGAAGPFSITDTLLVSPCDVKSPITVTGRLASPTVTIVPSSIDFGSIDACGSQVDSTASVTLSIGGLSGLRSSLTSVTVKAPFKTNAVVGGVVFDGDMFTVTYTPVNSGIHTDTLVLVVAPCNDTVRCVLTGRRSTPGSVSYVTSSDFGVIGQGQVTQQKCVVKNTGSSNLVVENLAGIVDPWKIGSTSIPLPANLAAGDSVEFVLEYHFLGFGRRDTLLFYSFSSGICADTSWFTIFGATVPKDNITGITMVISDTAKGYPGNTINVPVSMTSTEPPASLTATTAIVYISYNGSVLLPSAIVDATGLTGTVDFLTPNSSKITLSSSTPIPDTGYIFTLSTRIFLGSELVAAIIVDSVIVADATIAGSDGKVTVLGDCSVETKTLLVGKPASAQLVNAVKNAIELEVTTNTDHPIRVDIYDIDGRQLETGATFYVRPGIHRVVVRIDNWNFGGCLLHVTHGRYNTTIPIVLP